MHDAAVLLKGVRDRILDLVAEATPEQLALPVPATGGRTVRDVAGDLPNTSPEASQLTAALVDAVTCEHDLRAVLDRPGFRDDPSVLLCLDVLAAGLSERVAAAGLPALRVTVEQWGTVAGRGPAVRCLVADRFELVRGMSGRRSASQVERWNWDAPPGPYLELISATGLPEHEIRERDPRVPDHLRDLDLTH